MAVTAQIQGTVELTVTVGADGRVQDVKLVRGHPVMVGAAVAAVKQWIYSPATVDGKGVPFITQVLVPFQLQ